MLIRQLQSRLMGFEVSDVPVDSSIAKVLIQALIQALIQVCGLSFPLVYLTPHVCQTGGARALMHVPLLQLMEFDPHSTQGEIEAPRFCRFSD
jgi:hypothetical protein